MEKNKEKNNNENKPKKKYKNKIFSPQNIFFFFIPIIIFFNIYLFNTNPEILELKKRVKELESKIGEMETKAIKKKIKIGFYSDNMAGNRIGRFETVLSELLVKTGKYDVYLINKIETEFDYKYNKKIHRNIIVKDKESLKNFDEENDIQVYIISNDVSEIIDYFQSFGKKVIGVFHGIYFLCAFQDETLLYKSWKDFIKFDSFVISIPDDYWIYKKLGFNNTIYFPYIKTFDYKNTPSSPLTSKNILMVGRTDETIKGAKYGILAMSEILKKIPDARLTIIGLNYSEDIEELINNLNIKDRVNYPGYSLNITEFYLNASVLLAPYITESGGLVINEAKAHGIPIVAFNIDYCPTYNSGVITVEMLNYKKMAKEVIKLLDNFEYRKKKGEEAKLSLKDFESNDEIVELWDKLIHSVLSGGEDYTQLQRKIEKKYYNSTVAEEHLKKHYKYVQKVNNNFRCHSLNDLTNLEYIKSIESC